MHIGISKSIGCATAPHCPRAQARIDRRIWKPLPTSSSARPRSGRCRRSPRASIIFASWIGSPPAFEEAGLGRRSALRRGDHQGGRNRASPSYLARLRRQPDRSPGSNARGRDTARLQSGRHCGPSRPRQSTGREGDATDKLKWSGLRARLPSCADSVECEHSRRRSSRRALLIRQPMPRLLEELYPPAPPSAATNAVSAGCMRRAPLSAQMNVLIIAYVRIVSTFQVSSSLKRTGTIGRTSTALSALLLTAERR